MLFDSHTHTIMSADSDMSPQEAMQKAEEHGIGIIFTEHVDYDLPSEPLNFVTDVEKYLSEYEAFRSDRVFLGLEIGLTPESVARNRKLAEDIRLDYIIGSIHLVDGLDICSDLYTQGIGERGTYIQYLRYVRDMIEKNDFFDSLGHLDYPTRYSHFANRIINYNEYSPFYDVILDSLIAKNKCLEINTVNLQNRHAAANYLQICKRYYAMGGRYVTIGSDAHNANAIGRSFSSALEISRASGLIPVYFIKRKLSLCE